MFPKLDRSILASSNDMCPNKSVRTNMSLQEVPSGEVLLDDVLSDEVLLDDVLSGEVLLDDVLSDEVLLDEVLLDESKSVGGSTSLEFLSDIKGIWIYNASFGTRELGPALLSAIRSVYFKPWNVKLVDSLDEDRDDILYIIICPAGLGMKGIKMPKYYINWQLEYLNGNYDNDVYVNRLRGALSNWDYSQFNIDICKKRYNIESIYVPPGFNETISTPDILNGSYLYTDEGKDVDVLFLGYCEAYPRRIHIRDNCYRSHMRMWFVSDLDLEGMKRAIRRSKICINMAAFEGFILHKIRMNILLANQACVLSEVSIDREADIPYGENGVCFVPYESIIEKAWDLLLSLIHI